MYSGHSASTYCGNGYLACGNSYTYTNSNNTLYSYTRSHKNANCQTVGHTNERDADSNTKRRKFRATDLGFLVPRWTMDRADNRKIPN